MAHEFHKPRNIYRDCEPFPEDTPRVRGYDFNQGVDHKALLQSLLNTGFQATQFGRAVQEVNRMIEKRKQPWKVMDESSCKDHPPHCPCLSSCTIFLGYTSNMISSGVRESIRYLAQHRMELLSSQRPDLVFHSSQRQSNAEGTNRLDDYVVSKVDVLVTTAGGIEEDLIKCLGPVYLGEFNLSGRDLYVKRINRIGNLLMPEENYRLLMEWMEPILKQMLLEQNTQGVHWTPSKVIQRFGKEINHPESVCYWAYKNDIPVFSPALTDGAIGDVLYLFSVENPGLIVDITEDISRMNSMALAANSSGIIILGGGVAKHHICNANIWKKGADFAVYVNTAQEADGSDSGAKPDEAVTWGKIKMDAKPVKVVADATLIFPLLVAETFAVNADKQ